MINTLSQHSGVITGALGGIGAGMCDAFLAAGAQIALFDLDDAKVKERAAELGESAIGIGLDITDPAQVEKAFGTVKEHFGSVDFLINNAGIRYVIPFLDQDMERWQRTLDVNVTGSFLCAQAAARIMVGQGRGKIVNISSNAATLAFRNRVAYVTSKAAVVGLTKAIAWELGAQGIFCNAIAPGVTETPLTAAQFAKPDFAKTVLENAAVRRWGQPKDIADAAIFLCSPASDYIQGTTLQVDGGWESGKGW